MYYKRSNIKCKYIDMSVTYLDQLSTETSPLSSDKLLGVRGTGVGSERLFSIGDLAEANLAQATIIATEIANEAAAAEVVALNTKGGVFYPEDFGPLSATLPISHTAIQAAIDAAAVLGGTVILPPQKMLLGASLVPRSGVSMRGVFPSAPTLNPWDIGYTLVGGSILSFPGGVIFQQDTSADFATHTGLTNFQLHCIGFDGFDKIISTGAQSKHGALGCIFENLIAANGTGTALEIINPQHTTIRKVTLRTVRRGAFFGSNYRLGEVECAPGNSVVDELYVQLDASQDDNYGVKCETMAGSEFILGAIEFRRLQVNRFHSVNKLGNHIVIKGTPGYPTVAITFSSMDLEGHADSVIDMDWTDRCSLDVTAISPSNEWNTTVRVANSVGLLVSSSQRDTRVEFLDDNSAGSTVGIGAFKDNGVGARKLMGCYSTNGGFVMQWFSAAQCVITGLGESLITSGTFDLRASGKIKVGTYDYPVTATVWSGHTSGTIEASSAENQTLTLPSPASNGADGETVTIVKTAATGVVTVANIISGDITLTTQHASVQLRATTSGWRVINRYLT